MVQVNQGKPFMNPPTGLEEDASWNVQGKDFWLLSAGEATQKIYKIMTAYLTKTKNGEYAIPRVNRLPLYLYGPPGVGKTAITKKAAQMLGIAFVSFSLTHQTRNSILGLPVITEVGDEKYTRYTMSEIIAEVEKEVMKGHKEGILLLDEFNCVSDTVLPVMLEFLQTGRIGTHMLPEGWVLVLCGNPPKYNKSARTLGPAIADRVRQIEVSADLKSFEEYAETHDIHPLILDFVKNNPTALYQVSERPENEGSWNVVTPRGWENLSWLLKNYEASHIEADREDIYGLIKNEKTARDFYQYYQRFWKEERVYNLIEKILNGEESQSLAEDIRTKSLGFRWELVDCLVNRLGWEAGQALSSKDAKANMEKVSSRLSKTICFLKLLPDTAEMLDKLMVRINDQQKLLEVLLQVKNPEYLELCKRAYGIRDDKAELTA